MINFSRGDNSEFNSPGKKLTPQELNRLRINQASEFYRRQREMMSTQKSSSLDSSDDLNVVSPLARDQQTVEKSGTRSFRMVRFFGQCFNISYKCKVLLRSPRGSERTSL